MKWAVWILLLAGPCLGETLSPAEALIRYLQEPRDAESCCADQIFAVEVDASLPKLKKHGSMKGFELISRAGRTAYRGLQFTGDNLVKTNVIARFLSNNADRPERPTDTAVNRENYTFTYAKTSGYNDRTAYVFRLKPLRKREGLFKGELWLDANTGETLRLWGDLVKSPSIFVRSFRFVQDYQNLYECVRPLRLLLTVQTRLAGEADMTVWLRPVDGAHGLRGTTSGFED
jgi:hypothetical protein